MPVSALQKAVHTDPLYRLWNCPCYRLLRLRGPITLPCQTGHYCISGPIHRPWMGHNNFCRVLRVRSDFWTDNRCCGIWNSRSFRLTICWRYCLNLYHRHLPEWNRPMSGHRFRSTPCLPGTSTCITGIRLWSLHGQELSSEYADNCSEAIRNQSPQESTPEPQSANRR